MSPAVVADRSDADPADRFGCLACLLADSDVSVSTSPAVSFAYTDLLTIHTPEMTAAQIREAVVVQSLLLANGSLQTPALNSVRDHARAQRYFAVEAHRVLASGAERVPLVGWIAARHRVTAITDSPESSARWARSNRPVPPIPAHWGTVRPDKLVDRSRSSAEAEAEANPPPTLDGLGDIVDAREDVEKQPSGLDELLARIYTGARGPLARLLFRAAGANSRRRLRGPLGGSRAVGATAVAHMAARPSAVSGGQASISKRSERELLARLPEWDHDHQQYRNDWCSVYRDPDPTVEVVEPLLPASDALLRRRLGRLGLVGARVWPERNGDMLDLDSIVRAEIARRTEYFEDRLFVTRLPRKPSVGVLLLVDCSGSTNMPADDFTTLDRYKRTSVDLLAAMTGVGYRTAALAVHSMGRATVNVRTLKSFDEAASSTVWDRIARLRAGGFSRLGAGLRYGAEQLTTYAGTDHVVLIVLTDGYAFDHHYEGAYAAYDVAHSIDEMRQSSCTELVVRFSPGPAGANPAARLGSWPRPLTVHNHDDMCRQLPNALRLALGSTRARSNL